MRILAIAIASVLAAQPVEWEEITARSGVAFQHLKSGTSRKYLIESVGSGVAMLDYDGDGFLDLYFVNGATLRDPMKAGAQPAKDTPAAWNRLYRNRRDGTFDDVTTRAGVAGAGYGMGAAAGDFDNDGRVDLYVTAFPRNQLFRNRGDGTFEDVTSRAGVEGGGWSSSAGWMDLDGDGWLDLVVARYVRWDFEPDIWCGAKKPGYRSYCHPDQFEPAAQLVFRNRRDGAFDRIEWKAGKGLGVAFADYDGDGRIDTAIANDSFPQQLFHNLGGWTFEEIGLEANVAYNDDGHVFGGMGIDFGDADNDGRPDLIINALAMQRYAFFRNTGKGFDYASDANNVGRITQRNSGWGMRLADFDNDGWRDLFVAQGHVMDNIQVTQTGLLYREPLLLLRNISGKFADVSRLSGAPFRNLLASRGAAFGDLDNDGWLDAAINVNDGAAVILRNRGGNGNHWLMIDAPIGSLVKVVTGMESQTGLVSAAGSFLSSQDPRLHFGLGSKTKAGRLEVTLPGGAVRVLHDQAADRIVKIR